MRDIIYAATPIRLQHLTEEICDFIEQSNYIPLHPFFALPYQRYNYDRFTKDEIYHTCFRLIDSCDQLWIFGINSGSLREYQYATSKNMPVQSLIKKLDPNWEEQSKKTKYNLFGDLIKNVIQ